MDMKLWLAFAGAATVFIVLPGPAALLCVNHGARHGARRALATVFGGTLSALALMSASALGVSSLVAASQAGFEFVRVAGAAGLVMIGLAGWHASGRRPVAAVPVHRETAHGSLFTLCRDGFLVGISNPKDLLFFGALLPQFVDPLAPSAPQFAGLFVIWAVIDGVAMGSYAAVGQRLARWLSCPARVMLFQRASSALLISMGAYLGLIPLSS
jgi:homoserine/homoserine lactone efflux protein